MSIVEHYSDAQRPIGQVDAHDCCKPTRNCSDDKVWRCVLDALQPRGRTSQLWCHLEQDCPQSRYAYDSCRTFDLSPCSFGPNIDWYYYGIPLISFIRVPPLRHLALGHCYPRTIPHRTLVPVLIRTYLYHCILSIYTDTTHALAHPLEKGVVGGLEI